jgi:hypothetical protein
VILGELLWASYRTRVTWPLVTGTVTSNQTLSGKGKHGETTYGVSLAVEYVRNGHPLVGQAQTYVWTVDQQEHLENLQRYPPGTKLQIRYNPNDPTEVRLSPDLIESVPTAVILGIFLLGTALGLLFVRGRRLNGVLKNSICRETATTRAEARTHS